MTKNPIFYQDPSHGWLAVKRQDLHDLRIAHMITTYSYQRGQTVYLEEDLDMWVYLKAREEIEGRKLEVVEKHINRRSHIRGYRSYKPCNS